jgi:hypothetical protein
VRVRALADGAGAGWVEAGPGVTAAVALDERLGFSIVGTVPEAFAQPRHGRVGLHVMGRAP